MYLMAHLSRWLDSRSLDAAQVAPDVVSEFLRARRDAGYAHLVSSGALGVLLGFLRDEGVVAQQSVRALDTPVGALMERYHRYLIGERRLAAQTVRRYQRLAHAFLSRMPDPIGDLKVLSAGQVTRFVMGECAGRSAGSAQAMVTELRCLLRFLHVTGSAPGPLTGAVPSVANWKLSALPYTPDAGQVASLLDSCNRDTAMGRRDHSVLLLLARLGLRAGEVAGLELGDVNWRVGELMIRGKGRRLYQLPLPMEVGAAMASYLSQDRPGCASRRLFITVVAPRIGLTPGAVTRIVARACRRAGLPCMYAYRVRHFAATQMLRYGASLNEIGQVLRHRDQSTTAIYAKVDHVAMAALARPWPGAA
jgi:site-specific recombinase XerD